MKTAIAAVLGAMSLVVLDAAVVNVALPALAEDLKTTPGNAIWVMTSYQFAIVMALLPCAALGESAGYRRVFAAGVGLFTLASGLCAWAPNLQWLLAARFLQGLGAAAVMALGVALLRFTVPHHKLGAAIGWNALVVALSAAAGPSLGAAILAVGPWPWLFAFKIPLGIGILFATRALPKPEVTGRPLDLVSVSLNAGALAGLITAIQFASMTPLWATGAFIFSALCFAYLIRRERPKETPLIPFDLLRRRPFRFAVLSSVLCFTGQTAGLVALPFYLQHGLHQSVFATGLFMTAWPLTVAIGAPVVGRLSNVIAASWLCAIGALCLAAGLSAAALWPLHSNSSPLIAFTMLCGLGFGLFNVPNNRTMFLSAPRQRSGAAGAMQGSARLLGQTAGALVMTLLFTLTPADVAPRLGLLLGAVFTVAASVISVLRREAEACSQITT